MKNFPRTVPAARVPLLAAQWGAPDLGQTWWGVLGHQRYRTHKEVRLCSPSSPVCRSDNLAACPHFPEGPNPWNKQLQGRILV